MTDPHSSSPPDDLCDRDCERCGDSSCDKAGRDMEMERVEHEMMMRDE